MIEVTLKWDKTFAPRWNRKFTAMQTQLDQSCMKYMTQYTPVASAKYANAGKLAGSISNPEPGRIIYSGNSRAFGGQPVSRHAYYTPMNHLRSGNPQATDRWFETMKAKDMNKIRSEVVKAGGFKK